MEDVPSLHFFKRDGRQHAEEWIGFLQGHAQLLAVVPVFQDGLTLEQNVANIATAAKTPLRWSQRCYIYNDDVTVLVLAAESKDRKGFVAHLEQVRQTYNQPGYALCENGQASLVTPAGITDLGPFHGSLDAIDALSGRFYPGFKTIGFFDRSMNYVQMRDYQTRPRSVPGQPPASGGEHG